MNDFTYIFATKIVEVFPISIVSNVFLNIKIICAQNSRYAPVFSILLDTFFSHFSEVDLWAFRA